MEENQVARRDFIDKALVIRNDRPVDDVLAFLDLLRGIMEHVSCIEVPVDDVVSPACELIQAARGIATYAVGGTEVLWYQPDDVSYDHLVVYDLLLALSWGDFVHVLVCPAVGADLMALGHHATDEGRVRARRVVDHALADAVTAYEEGSLDVVFLEDVENSLSVCIGSVVEGKSYLLLHLAAVDNDTYKKTSQPSSPSVTCMALLRDRYTIRNIRVMIPEHILGVFPARPLASCCVSESPSMFTNEGTNLLGITSPVAEVDLALRSLAEVRPLATEPSLGAAFITGTRRSAKVFPTLRGQPPGGQGHGNEVRKTHLHVAQRPGRVILD